jgi:hypothetical protein
MATIARDCYQDARYAARIARVETVLASLRESRSPRPGGPPVPAGLEHIIAEYERELAVLGRRLRALQQ